MRRLLALLFLLPLLLRFLAVPCSASPEEALSDLYGGLPEEIRSRLPDGVSEDLAEGKAAEAAKRLNVSYLTDQLNSALDGAVAESLSPLLLLLATVFLAALLHAFSDTAGEAAGKAVGFAAGLANLTAVFSVVKPAWELTANTVKGIGLLTKSILPAMTALCAASGSPSSSTVNASWLTVLLTLLEQLSETVLPPLFAIGFGFLAVSAFSGLSGAPDLSGVVGSLKGIFTFFLSLIGTVLTAVMTYQSVLAESADTVALRGLKFASGHMIPVVGGVLSETAGSYLASLSLLRGSAGALTATALILLILPPLLKLTVCRLGFTAAATVSGLLGCGAESSTIREASGLLDLALATVAILTVMLLILIGVFASTAVSL